MPRYRFGPFVVSPRRRVLLRDGRELPLIPRYFDLLVFLVERRHEAVHRRDIFDRVWQDVIVSDSALSQAIRTIRRVLDDDSREPRFVRTVSRHGYQFVFAEVVEDDDDAAWPTTMAPAAPTAPPPPDAPADAVRALAARLAAAAHGHDEGELRDLAEQAHALGATAVLAAVGDGPAAARVRAMLRDTRWDTPDAEPVPIVGAPHGVETAAQVVRLRWRRAWRLAARRWGAAALGAGMAGAAAGVTGGVVLVALSGGVTRPAVVPVLALLGVVAGAVGAAGIAAGLTVAETVARSWRSVGLVGGAALGGGAVGLLVQWLARWTLHLLLNLEVPVGGALDGTVLGLAAGAGYALATRQTDGGLAAPRGRARLQLALVVAAACGLAALGLSLAGRPLVGGTIRLLAQATTGTDGVLTPLGQLLGEPGFGPATARLLGVTEGALFGAGLALGLTRRR